MRDAVEDSRLSPVIRQKALAIVAPVRSKDWQGEAEAVFDWVRENIRYTRDPRGIELIHTPEGVLDDGQGDCDDHSILVGSLLDAIGHRVRFKAVSFSPGDFVHVYSQTLIGRTWFALDTTEDHPPGWQPPRIYDRMIIHVPQGDRGVRRRWFANGG